MIVMGFCITSVCSANINFTSLGDAYYLSGCVEGVIDNVLTIKVANESNIAHVSYIPLDTDGNFTYSFRIAEHVESDIYNVEIWGNGVGKVFEESLEYANDLKKEELMRELNNADTAEKAKAVVEELIRFRLVFLPDNTPVFDDSAKSKFYNRICGISDFTLNNYRDKIQTEVAVATFQAADQTTISSVVDLFGDIFDFESQPLYEIYEKADKQKVLKIILKNDIKDLESIRKSFNIAIVLNEINSKDSHGDIISVINNEDYASYLPEKVLNLPESKKMELALKLVDRDVYTMRELEDLIPQENDDDDDHGSGSSGGSGRGRTGKTVVRTEVVVDQELAQSTTGIESFADIADAEWARTAIEYLLNRKVINGYDDGDFKPNNNITREEFVKLVCKAFGIGESGPDCGFMDVDKNHWAYGYICAAKEKGIIKGISDTLFGIGNNITRQDMAVIIANVLELSGAANGSFTDEETIADYAKPAVNALKNAGIISGYEDGSFRPYNFTTRAEAAQIIYKVLQSK